MTWHISLHTDATFVETTYTGHLTLAALHSALQETLTLAARYQCQRLLRDCLALENQPSLSDLYFLMDTFGAHRPSRLWKEAVLLRDLTDLSLVQCWQTTANNRGYKVRCFDQRQPALDWLLQD